MKGLKDFRRSLNKDRTSGGKPGSSAAPAALSSVKSGASSLPPKMVIKATSDYRSRAPQELSFMKGDFFHVISDPAPDAEWFEASNPITNARGLVPAAAFEILGKSSRPGIAAGPGHITGLGIPGASQAQTPAQRAAGAAMTAKGGGGLYAVVKYDFAAERGDELGAKAGESIIVIAQSNFEWFVAKPIGRLGGPGLIPVAFVEIKDLVTGQVIDNVDELISSGVIPKVEEWKKMTAEYKKNTIPLGRFDFPQQPGPAELDLVGGTLGTGLPDDREPSPSLPPKDGHWLQQPIESQQAQQNSLPLGMPPGEPLPVGIITHATVDSFHYEQGDYWFRLQASHIAGASLHAPPTAPRAPDGEERDLILYRLYEDFYEFQIALLDHFPAEAGRQVDENGQQSQRILPLMPGPLDKVDDYITAQRRGDLDQYISELCALPEYILRSELVRLFFEPRPGDHCTTHPLHSAANSSAHSNKAAGKAKAVDDQYSYGATAGEDVRTPNPPPAASTRYSNGTQKYAEDQPVGAHTRNVSSSSKAAGAAAGELSNKMDNLSMGTRSSGHSASNSRSSAPGGPSGLQPPHGYLQRNASVATVESQNSRGSGGQFEAPGSRGSGGTTAGGNASGAAPSFIKIKIFHRANDDLVAIRVPPNVTHSQLMDKVRDRLGADINVLRYRDPHPEPGGSGMVRMHDDDDLKDWLSSGAKFNLYADRT